MQTIHTRVSLFALMAAMVSSSPALARQVSEDPATPVDGAAKMVSAPTAQAGEAAKQGDSVSPSKSPDNRSSAKEDNKEASARKKKGKKRDGANFDDAHDILVTGSRLQHGDPTSRVTVLTAEDIKARGVTTVEELIRTLPQNLATIGAITNDRGKGPLKNREAGKAEVKSLGLLGVAAANLGGSGAGNTLVLINGRRVAGAAGIEDGFVNLTNIPLNAVERVEIDTNGSAAVYGADAIGGVINFILKNNYRGFTLSARHEFSSAEASNSRLSASGGYAWSSGNAAFTADYTRINPINNYKTGYTTENYSSLFGGNSDYDYRSFARGLQPGVIVYSEYVPNASGDFDSVERAISLRKGITGRPTVDDFVELDPDAKRDYVAKYGGPKSESIGFSANIEQNLTSKLGVFVEGLYSRTKNHQITDYREGLQVELAPGQYYNPFPANTFDSFVAGAPVYYFPEAEIADGTLQGGTISIVQSQWTINAGVRYQITPHTRAQFTFTASRSTSKADSTLLGPLVNSFVPDENSPSGFSCYNFALAENQYRGPNIDEYKAAFQRQCTALTSSDPAVAFNPFKTGSGGTGSGVTTFLYHDASENRSSTMKNYDFHINGVVVELPAGRVNYAVGAEYNDDGVNSREVNLITGTAQSRTRYAGFVEMTVPILGRDMTLPGVRALTLTGAARSDTYLTDGAVGTVDDIPYTRGGKIIYGHNRFSRITPSFGVRWEPLQDFAVRARWSRGFRPPPYTQLFSIFGSRTYSTTIYDDPLYTCTTDCTTGTSTRHGYAVPVVQAPNPNLRPQVSTQRNLGVSWTPQGGFLRGLALSVTYNRTHIYDEYANQSTLDSVLRGVEQLKLPQFYPRDPATGKILAWRNMIFNIAGSEYSSITYEASYSFATKWGDFRPNVTVLDNLKAERQVTFNSNPISTLGTVFGPDDYRVIGSLAWSLGSFNAMLLGYYTPSYKNNYLTGLYGGRLVGGDSVRTVSPFTTFDLTGSWQIRDRLRLNIAGRNIFKAPPPFTLVERRPYDTARYNVAGRTVAVEAQWSF